MSKRSGIVVLVVVFIWLIYTPELIAQGFIFNDDEYKNAPIKAQLMRGDYKVPPSASIKQFSPRMGDQLSYHTSVAWAIAWQARTLLYARNHELDNLDARNESIFAPAYLYSKAQGDTDCYAGITLEAGLKAAKTHGMPFFRDYIYFCGGPNDQDITELASKHTITDYSKVFELHDTDDRKKQLVKKSISEGWPVIIGMNTPPSFSRAKEFWQPTENPEKQYVGHALCVVGYDDNKYGGAFEVANSWGGNWGNDGFMWIRYQDFADYVRYGYEIFVAPKEKEYRLQGKVVFKLASNESMPVVNNGAGKYKMRDTYTSGTQFQVFVTTEDPAFVYIFGSDLTNSCFQIFPHEKSVSPALTYKSSHIAIPDEQHFIEFDNTAGTDFLCVIYSRDELDIEGIISQVEKSKGTFQEKVEQVIGEHLLNSSVNWSENQISFDTKTQNGSVVAVMIEIDHI